MKDAVNRDSSRNQTSTLIIWSLTELSSFWIGSSEIHTLRINCGLASLGITSLQAGSGGIKHRELLRRPSQYTYSAPPSPEGPEIRDPPLLSLGAGFREDKAFPRGPSRKEVG